MGAEPFLGEITIFAGNFPPHGYAFCHGQLLPINQNQALFALLGTMYGGNGTTTFALPDLRGRVPMGAGQGPGLTARQEGETLGSERVELLTTVVNSVQAEDATVTSTTTVRPTTLGASTEPVPTVPPATVLNYIIALQGIFPSRW